MEVITLSGLISESVKKKTDKKGREFLIFRVSCKGKNIYGEERVTTYTCFCYNTKYAGLKKNDVIFLTGSLNIFPDKYSNIERKEIYVQQISQWDATEEKGQ